MTLPKISHPTFTLTLPSTGQEVVYRPFLVKEEKILLTAQTANDSNETIRAIKQVIKNCILSENIDVEDFSTFDFEYFFIKLRARSVNNIVNLSYRDNQDNKIYNFEVDLDQIEVKKNKDVFDNIVVNNDLTIKLRYPKIKLLEQTKNFEDPIDLVFLILKNCLYQIEYKGSIINTSEYVKEDLDEFINNLDIKTYQNIQKYFDVIPKIEHILSYTNSNGKEVKIVLNSITDFFSLG